MPQLSITIPHTLTQDEVVKRIKEKAESAKSQATGVVMEWEGYTMNFAFAVMGVSVKGHLIVEPHEIQIHVELPWIAKPFFGQIESRVREECQQLLT